MAGVQVHNALVTPPVGQTVRDQHALTLADEIMVVGPDRLLRLDHASAVEIPQPFLLLGVAAQHGQARRQVLRLEPGQVRERGVAVGMFAHGLLLDRLTAAITGVA